MGIHIVESIDMDLNNKCKTKTINLQLTFIYLIIKTDFNQYQVICKHQPLSASRVTVISAEDHGLHQKALRCGVCAVCQICFLLGAVSVYI